MVAANEIFNIFNKIVKITKSFYDIKDNTAETAMQLIDKLNVMEKEIQSAADKNNIAESTDDKNNIVEKAIQLFNQKNDTKKALTPISDMIKIAQIMDFIDTNNFINKISQSFANIDNATKENIVTKISQSPENISIIDERKQIKNIIKNAQRSTEEFLNLIKTIQQSLNDVIITLQRTMEAYQLFDEKHQKQTEEELQNGMVSIFNSIKIRLEKYNQSNSFLNIEFNIHDVHFDFVLFKNLVTNYCKNLQKIHGNSDDDKIDAKLVMQCINTLIAVRNISENQLNYDVDSAQNIAITIFMTLLCVSFATLLLRRKNQNLSSKVDGLEKQLHDKKHELKEWETKLQNTKSSSERDNIKDNIIKNLTAQISNLEESIIKSKQLFNKPEENRITNMEKQSLKHFKSQSSINIKEMEKLQSKNQELQNRLTIQQNKFNEYATTQYMINISQSPYYKNCSDVNQKKINEIVKNFLSTHEFAAQIGQNGIKKLQHNTKEGATHEIKCDQVRIPLKLERISNNLFHLKTIKDKTLQK